MYLRFARRMKNGKEHRYWSIAESKRCAGGKVVQRPVLYLGEINDSQHADWCRVIETLDADDQRNRQLALFPADRSVPEHARGYGVQGDSITLRPFLRKIEEQYGKAERIWVMDRGIPTEEVLAEMRQADPPIYYLVGTPKGRLTKLEKALLKLPWQAVREGVNVKLLPKDAELYVLAKSDARILKERGIRRRKLRWLLARLKEISNMELQRDDLLMKLGAARAKAPAAWRLVAVEVAPEGATFSYALNRKKLRKVWRREGRYLLRTNLSGRDPAELWQFYIQLVEVEAAFKNLKDDLQLRPIYHELIGRIEAHIFVALLAYCLHVTLRARLRPLASGLTPRAVLDKFAAIQMLDVHFPTTDGRTLILSRYTELNADQKLLVKQLNLDLPVQPRPRITTAGQIVQAAAPAL